MAGFFFFSRMIQYKDRPCQLCRRTGDFRLKHYAMRSHLTVTFAVIALIPILILGVFQVFQITRITQETNQNQRQTTYRLADAVEAYMSYHRNAVETLAATISASDAAFRTKESLTLKLQSLQTNLAGFAGIYVVSQQGSIVASHQPTMALIGTDVQDRDYTKRIRAGHTTIVSSLFQGLESGNVPALAIAVPVYKGDKEEDGFVLAVLELAPIKALVTKYKYGTDAYPVVLDHAGKPIYHPAAELTASMANLSEEPVVMDARMNLQGEGTYTLATAEQKEFITYKLIPNLNMIVWVSRSKASVNAAFNESLRLTLGLLLLTLIVTLLLGSLIAKRLNGTIHALVGYTQRLAGGAYAVPDSVTVPRDAPLELHQLAEHFGVMADEIRAKQTDLLRLNTELEQRVEDRTQRLAEEHTTLNAVLESMSDAIVLIDMAHRVRYANPRMAESFGLEMAALAGMREEDLFARIAEWLPEGEEEQLAKLADAPSVQLDLTVAAEGGKPRFLRVFAFEVAREGRVFGRGYVWQDRTKEQEVDALKNDLISLASHEFKTPMTSIRGNVETLLRRDAQWEDDFKQELLEGIHEDIGRIQDLIDEWLDISKIESGVMGIQREPLQLAAVVDSARVRFPAPGGGRGMVFQVELPASLPLINADKRRMEQVLLNLFANAVRYNEREPHIRLTAEADERFVYLHVADNGIGIAPEHVDKLFDRFYRVDVSSSRQTGGTGLGLAICKGIMEAHGGSISVVSRPGAGSTFTLAIPRFIEGEKEED